MKTINEALDYEIKSSWLAPYISNPFLQDLLGYYFAWKVRRKYNRYVLNTHYNKWVKQKAKDIPTHELIGGKIPLKSKKDIA